MVNEFVSRDLYLSAFLYAKGATFKGISRENKICWFLFEDKEFCKTLQSQFFSKTAQVNAKEYSDAIKTLKDLVFAETRGF